MYALWPSQRQRKQNFHSMRPITLKHESEHSARCLDSLLTVKTFGYVHQGYRHGNFQKKKKKGQFFSLPNCESKHSTQCLAFAQILKT